MAFCSKCGKELEEDAQFCPSCGTPVNGNTAEKDKTNSSEAAKEKAKLAADKAKEGAAKLKTAIDKLPFNNLARKYADYANYAVCVIGILLLIGIISAIKPNKSDSKKTSNSTVAEKSKDVKKTATTKTKKAKQEKSKELLALESKIKEDFDATPEGLIAGSLLTFWQSDENITERLLQYALKEDSAKVKDLEDLQNLFTVMMYDDPSSVYEIVEKGEVKAKALEDKVNQIISEKETGLEEVKKAALKYKKKLAKNLSANKVKVGNFEIQKTEVTQPLYYAVAETNPSNFAGPNLPVERVSWYDAIIFCNKLSERTKLTPCYSVKGSTDTSKWGTAQKYKWNDSTKKYDPDGEADYTPDDVEWNKDANGWRLPTEEEWLLAAEDGHKYSGSDKIDEVAWYSNNSDKKTHDVATKAANANGIHDMSGNILEWCWDKDDSKGSAPVVRGGAYKYDEKSSEVSYRFGANPDRSNDPFGIRLVRNAK